MSIQRDRARHLRRNMTDAEKFVWNQLGGRRLAGYKFRRQAPIGPYIADFVSFDERLIVELDGQHHAEPQHCEHDQRRTSWLARNGFRVLRFTNAAVIEDIAAAERVILGVLRQEALPPHPLPLFRHPEGIRRGEPDSHSASLARGIRGAER